MANQAQVEMKTSTCPLFPELASPTRVRKLKSAQAYAPLSTLSAKLQKHHAIWGGSRARLTIASSLHAESKGLSTPSRLSSAPIA